MHPWLSQEVGSAHRQDMLRDAQRRSRRAPLDAAREPRLALHTSWNTKMGSLLIRVGTRLSAEQPQLQLKPQPKPRPHHI